MSSTLEGHGPHDQGIHQNVPIRSTLEGHGPHDQGIHQNVPIIEPIGAFLQ